MERNSEETHQVTALLHAWRAGDAAAGETLISPIGPARRAITTTTCGAWLGCNCDANIAP